VTPDGKRVLVCIRSVPGGLDIIDTTSLERVKTIPTKSGMHDMVVTDDGKYAIAGSPEGKFATFFDLKTEQIAWEIQYEKGAQPIAIENGPGGSAHRVFIQLNDPHGLISVVDFAKRQEVDRIKLPDEPSGFKGNSHGLGIAPDGKTLWVNAGEANAVFAYSLPDLKLLGHVPLPELKLPGKPPVGARPAWITFTPDSKTVYVSNIALKSVSAIDAKTMKVITNIPTGEVPNRISTLVVP